MATHPVAELSAESSFLLRFLAWAKERFPVPNILLTASLYLLAAPMARLVASGNAQLHWFDIWGVFSAVALFLLLRVLDEHKDYALDVVNHPQRVLQRGLITLNHLKVVGAICILLMLFGNLWIDSQSTSAISIPVSLSWLAMMLWLVLMTVEFFCPEWLNRHLVIYALSHMLIMPLIAIWMATMATGQLQLSPNLLLLGALFFFSGLCFEITRKTRGPDEDRPEVDSYSQIFGAKRSAQLVIGLLIAMSGLQLSLLYLTASAAFVFVAPAIVFCFLLALKQLLAFIAAPSLEGREKNEKAIGLAMLLGYWALTGSLLITA